MRPFVIGCSEPGDVMRGEKHRLGLRENALDSLNEGLRKYVQGRDEDDVGAYKFAVLHFAHFLELLLKSAVAKEHQLLVYVTPAKDNPKGGRTIGMWEAWSILRNAGHSLDESLHADLKWLKALRNDIEHYEFELEVHQVRSSLGRVLRAAVELCDGVGLPAIRPAVANDCEIVFEQLLDEFQDELANARADAKKAGDGDVTHCQVCLASGTAFETGEGVECLLCGETDLFRDCAVCTETYRQSECIVWNDDHPGEVDYACTYCEENIFGGD